MAFAQTIEFRFKLPEISSTTPLSQSLLVNRTGSTNTSTQFGVYLEYTGSLSSGSYSGSVVDPYYQYGTLKFIYPEANASASIYLPFLNGDWWSVMVTRNDNPYITYDLYAASKTLNEYGQYVVQYQGSSSLQTLLDWKKPGNVLIPGSGSSTILGKNYVPATGSFQELRYYNVSLSESQFNDYVVNSNSIEGNTLDSSYDELFFRAALGGELFTGSTSIHPAVNTTPSFDSGNSNFSYTGSYSFNSNTEIHYYDQVPAGIQNPVSQKIKQQNIVLPYSSSNVNVPNSDVLSPFISIQQSPSISQSYTRDIDYVEVAFSPQNEINDDINDELGYFNVGELIGDPRFQSSSLEYYPDLNALSNSYFKKYNSNYDWNDYVRLIKFFDNSLFKMLADWIPARASLASGIVIKNTLLDRNRYRTPQVSTEAVLANIGSGSTNIPYIVEDQTITGSIDVGNIEGGTGGSMPDLLGLTSSLFTYPGAVNITQVWDGSTPSLLGAVPFTESSQTEFYDGELSGSNLVVTNGILSDPTVITPVVYTTSSISVAYTYPAFFYSIPLEEGFARVTGSENIVNYNFKSERTYYLSFTATVGNYGSPLEMVIVNADRSFNPVSVTLNSATNIIQNLEVTGLLPYIYFLNINGVANMPIPFNPITITNFVVKESELLDPENDVVENDIQVSRPSSKYLDVDFTDNYITAVNEQAILSGSATKATVPDSNYTSLKSANPRYFGCETISPTGSIYEGFVNQPMVSGSSIGALTNVEQYCDWFAYFTNITTDEIYYTDGFSSNFISGSIVHITTLININGDVIDLSSTNNIPLSGSITPNPLISNIPLVNSIFPYSFYGNTFNSSSGYFPGIPVEIRQYITSGSQLIISGSFSSYNVLFSGIQSTINSDSITIPPFASGINSIYGIYNETIVTLNPYYPKLKSFISTNIPGLLIPQNFNPNFKNSILKIAQEAGFLNNI
jgi:hypothetical protein